MLGSAVLEVAIGLAFVFLLVSTICAAVREGIESILKSRSAYLEYGLRELLHDRSGSGLTASLYDHPLIRGLYLGSYRPLPEVASPPILAKGHELPSYIPARSFAMALLDIAARGPRTDLVSSDPSSQPLTVDSVRANLLNLDNPGVQRVLLYALDTSGGELSVARAQLEAWFDSAMERVSGWYKRATQWILLAIALTVAVLLNVDAVRIAQHLYRDDAVRSAVVARAEAAAGGDALGYDYDEASEALASLTLPIGWDAEALAATPVAWLMRILGWLTTALAATLGAPFWFDLLNKFMVIRSTVKPHEKSPEEASEDRQKGAASPSAALALAPVDAGKAAAVRDAESDVDACDVDMGGDETPDEELPAASGGTEPCATR